MSATARTETYRAFAQVYDRVMGDRWFPAIYRSFLWAIRTYAIPTGSLADAGCGTGTFLKHVVRPGMIAYGIDRSPEMIRIAAEKLRGTGVRLFVQDIRALALPKRVDVITCNFDTLNYLLSTADLGRALARCAANLVPDGHLLFDMIVLPPGHRERRSVAQEFRLPGDRSKWTTSWSTETGTSVVRMGFSINQPDGQSTRTTEVHVQRWYPLEVIRRLLRRVGLTLRGVRDMQTLRPISRATHWMKFVASRAGLEKGGRTWPRQEIGNCHR